MLHTQNQYHAATGRIVANKMRLLIAQNIHILANEYYAATGRIIAVKMILLIVQDILIQNYNYQ